MQNPQMKLKKKKEMTKLNPDTQMYVIHQTMLCIKHTG